MPLSKISINSVGRSRKAPDSPVTSIINAYADNRSDVSAPSSIQSMLKNTTETGDIGLFSVNPTDIAYPLLRASSRSSSLPYISDGLPKHQLNQLVGSGHQIHRRVVNSRQNSLQSHHGTTTSSIISMYQTESHKSVRPRTSHAHQDDQRAFSMSQSSQLSYNMSNHRSYGALRPRSPFAYPTRLKRPGYRPSSPTLTNFNGTDARTPFGLDKGASFRTPSPLSAPPYGKRPAVYPTNPNRSMPSLQRCPSPLSRPESRSSKVLPMPSHSVGQRPSSNQRNWPSHQGFPREISHGRILPRQPLPSAATQYYDYSEAFVEQRKQHDSAIPVLSLAEEVIPEVQGRTEQAQEMVRKPLMVKTKPVPQELPAADTVSKQARNNSMPTLESPSPVAATGKFLQQMSEWEKEHIFLSASPQDKRNKEKVNHESATTDNDDENEIVELPTIRDTFGHHILSSSRPEARNRFVRDSRCSTTDAAVQPAELSSDSHGNDSIKALRTVTGELTHTQEILPTMPLTAGERPQLVPWHISSLDFGHPQCETKIQDLVELSYQKPELPNLVRDTLPPSIRAPVPERSMSSRTSKDRFTRIFSIDDSFDDLDHAVLESGQDRAPGERDSAIKPSGNDYSAWSRDSSKLPSVTTEVSTGSNVGGDAVKVQDYVPVSNRPDVGCSQVDGDNFTDSHKGTGASTETLKRPTIRRDSPVNYSHLTVVELEGARHILSNSHQARQGPSLFSNQSENFSTSIEFNTLSQVCAGNEAIPELPVMTLLEAANVVPWEYDEPNDGDSFPIGRYRLKSKAERESERTPISASNTRSRNLQSSHSRIGPSDNSEPSIVRSSYDSPNPTGKAPRFKLKITRASSSTNGTVRITRQRSLTSLTSSPRPSFAIGADFFRTIPFTRKSKSEDHSDGRHDLDPMAGYRTFPTHAHFKEQLDNSAMFANQSRLRPPSSNQNITKAQSFFSDDSSNMDRKGGLRQRISQFKAIASRGNSTDDLRASFRPQGSKSDSRPQSGRNSVRSHEATTGMSMIEYKTWKIRQKFRLWWRHGEEKLKGLGGKVKKRSRRKRSASTELYPGV